MVTILIRSDQLMSSTSITVMIIFGMFSVSSLLKCKCFGDYETTQQAHRWGNQQLCVSVLARWPASWCGCDPGRPPVGSWSVTTLSVCDPTASGERWSRLPGVYLLKPSRSIRRNVRSGVRGEPELWPRSVGFCSLMRECRCLLIADC